MRFGYKLMSLIWTPVLLVSIHFLSLHSGARGLWHSACDHLIQLSGLFLRCDVHVDAGDTPAGHQYSLPQRAFLDPVVHMPNLRALSRELASHPWSALCLLRVPELEVLGRNYGVMLRIQYKQQLAQWINGTLQPNERVYHLTGYDMAVRLDAESHQQRIETLDEHIKQFVLSGMVCRYSLRSA